MSAQVPARPPQGQYPMYNYPQVYYSQYPAYQMQPVMLQYPPQKKKDDSKTIGIILTVIVVIVLVLVAVMYTILFSLGSELSSDPSVDFEPTEQMSARSWKILVSEVGLGSYLFSGYSMNLYNGTTPVILGTSMRTGTIDIYIDSQRTLDIQYVDYDSDNEISAYDYFYLLFSSNPQPGYKFTIDIIYDSTGDTVGTASFTT